MNEQEKNVKTEKLPKPFEKYIWLVISLAVAVAGYFLRTSDFELPFIVGVVVALILLVTIIIAAQKVSAERAALADNKEKKFKYILKTIMYYLYIIIAVVFVFMSLWIIGILTI